MVRTQTSGQADRIVAALLSNRVERPYDHMLTYQRNSLVGVSLLSLFRHSHMYRNLLVPLDGSAFSDRAMSVAAEIARRSGAVVHLAAVVDPSVYVPFVTGEIALPVFDAALTEAACQRDQQLLDGHVTALSAQGVTAVAHVLEGLVVESLAECAVNLQADLVVMTTHGRSGFSRLRMGSVASAFLSRASAPVLLVRGGDDEPASVPSGMLLCAVDGSPRSETIVSHAARFARLLNMPMGLMAVSVPRPMPMSPFGTELLADPAALDAEAGVLADYLASLLPQCPAGTTTSVLTDLTVVSTILEEAERVHAGAIALSTHGRSGFGRLMLGSVADALIRRSTLPLLVYRPSDEAK